MHVSLETGSPHLIHPLVAAQTRFFLDGVELRYCVEACEEDGFAIVLDPTRCSHGEHTFTRITGQITITQTLH